MYHLIKTDRLEHRVCVIHVFLIDSTWTVYGSQQFELHLHTMPGTDRLVRLIPFFFVCGKSTNRSKQTHTNTHDAGCNLRFEAESRQTTRPEGVARAAPGRACRRHKTKSNANLFTPCAFFSRAHSLHYHVMCVCVCV